MGGRYMHCGVQVIQNADGSSVLNHSKYCESIEQIQFKQRHPNESVTVEEKQHNGVCTRVHHSMAQD